MNLPLTDWSVLSTCTVKSVLKGSLRISTSLSDPLSSSTLYADWLNAIVVPKYTIITINTDYRLSAIAMAVLYV